MEPEQPYRPPSADSSRSTASVGSTSITPNMVQSLVRTRRWVVLMGVMGMIGSVLMVLGGILFATTGGFGAMSELGPAGGVVFGGFYILLGAVYFFPSLYLIRYGGAIKRMGGRANSAAIEDALQLQLSFWRFIGIIMAGVLIVYAAIIFFGIVAGVVLPRMG